MKRQTLAMIIGAITLIAGVVLAKFTSLIPSTDTRLEVSTANGQQNLQLGDYRISGPYRHENLTVFLIHGEDRLNTDALVTLEEALAQKHVVVYETSDVNELAIENVSANREIFVQAGDIVKGGRQDRALAVDVVVEPRSGKLPIDAFCVEHGRWSQRGAETANAFTMSEMMIATKDLKMAAKVSQSQSQVWEKVDEAQQKLSRSVAADVRAEGSASSLQLSLEHEKVRETADAYIEKLSGIVQGQTDIIGYAFAINGKLNSADVYASNSLFNKLWPKLLKASAIEATAETLAGARVEPVAIEQVAEFLARAEQGAQVSERQVTERIRMVMREGEQHVLSETRDLKHEGRWLHRNYLAK
ncbi:MAG TPA: DUF6569 family protein [Pyrinomonadaceae bacterium]|jgi:hypothetical protein|nr:DUF6569 family protein [Pyrinomonadaceae bacterium]